jgi:hypothetical protein
MERVNRDADAIRARCGRLIEFVKEFWPVLEPNATFVGTFKRSASIWRRSPTAASTGS